MSRILKGHSALNHARFWQLQGFAWFLTPCSIGTLFGEVWFISVSFYHYMLNIYTLWGGCALKCLALSTQSYKHNCIVTNETTDTWNGTCSRCLTVNLENWTLPFVDASPCLFSIGQHALKPSEDRKGPRLSRLLHFREKNSSTGSIMAPLPADFSYGEWNLVYNSLSFGTAAMGAATAFFFLQLPNVGKSYRTALTITGLVTMIACYNYFRIFNSWVAAFELGSNDGDYAVKLTGTPFNDALRYVDWIMTVPLLLIELILVMKLPSAETNSLCWKLGVAAAAMIALGYPGEIQDDLKVRWFWWGLSMLPFCHLAPNSCQWTYLSFICVKKVWRLGGGFWENQFVVIFGDSCKWGYLILVLVAGLSEATNKQPTATASTLVTAARYLTVITWFTYPVVYLVKNVGLAGATATMYEQVGYSVADVTAKAVFGVLIWAIAAEKSQFEEDGKLLPHWSGEVGRS